MLLVLEGIRSFKVSCFTPPKNVAFLGLSCLIRRPSTIRRMWDLNTNQLMRTTKGIEAYVNCVAANPSDKTCISASWDDSIR